MATRYELEKMINDLINQKNFLNNRQKVSFENSLSEEENSRIEKYLSDFTARQGVLLTIAGLLLALLPSSDENLRHLLLWSVPFLLIAIGFYIMSVKRVHFVALNNIHIGTPEDINPLLREIYFTSTKYHKWVDIFLVIFFSSFTLQTYSQILNITKGETSLIIMNILALALGAMRYFYVSGSFMSPSLFAHTTGNAPEHDQES